MSPDADIAIIGAGAAGLAAAIFAVESNPHLRVELVDSAKSIGAKILVSGGGRCNVTNSHVTASDFHGNRKIIDRVLRRFDGQATLRWFHALGVPLREEEHGKIFPASNKARTVLEALIGRCQVLGIRIHTEHKVQALEPMKDRFSIHHSQGTLRTKKVILATGGRSLPRTGSDGSGWTLAQSVGHTVNTTVPALVPLLLSPSFFHAGLAGVSHEVTLSTRIDGHTVDRRTGSLLWTHFGVSGPVVLDASRFWGLARAQGKEVHLHLNCFPGKGGKAIHDWIISEATRSSRKSVSSLLAERLPQRVATTLCTFLTPSTPLNQEENESPANEKSLATTTLGELNRATRHRLVNTLVDLSLPVRGTRGWNFAEVTAGGVPLIEINPGTLESRKIPGLYVIGEMLDCDGRIGGFNFQWAWATGYIAGNHVSQSIGKTEK